MGVLRAMERKGVNVSFYKPVAQPRHGGDQPDLTSSIVGNSSDMKVGQPLPMSEAENLIGNEKLDVLLETIVERYNQINKDADVTLIEGLVPTRKHPFANAINEEIAKTLGAEIVFVATPGTDNPSQLKERIEVACSNYGGTKNKKISGVIINKLNAPVDEAGRTRPDLSEIFDDADTAQQANLEVMQIFNTSPIRVLGCVPWKIDLIATRAVDMAEHLNAEIINEGDIAKRRIKSITFCARSLPNMIEHFKPGSLLVTSADRPDVIVAAALAAMNGVEIGAILLTGGYDVPAEISDLIKPALDTGLPIFKAQGNTWQTSLNLQSFSLKFLQTIKSVSSSLTSTLLVTSTVLGLTLYLKALLAVVSLAHQHSVTS
ncbi:phosphate acetyltransferase [Vibrio variabilis]|uniref:Phosphate acetyltransferase n=1 Tax=Vibrio variabilis TaxID=990271 RepID=A0ABQ0JEF2_9VIBR|nr:phosphate acetyltransferase [Vibrio variabilis]